jgi:hypothetical protein
MPLDSSEKIVKQGRKQSSGQHRKEDRAMEEMCVSDERERLSFFEKDNHSLQEKSCIFREVASSCQERLSV